MEVSELAVCFSQKPLSSANKGLCARPGKAGPRVPGLLERQDSAGGPARFLARDLQSSCSASVSPVCASSCCAASRCCDPARARAPGFQRSCRAQRGSCRAAPTVQRFAALDHLSALIEEASERGNLGLAHSTAHGKALAKILVLGAVVSKHEISRSRCMPTRSGHGSPQEVSKAETTRACQRQYEDLEGIRGIGATASKSRPTQPPTDVPRRRGCARRGCRCPDRGGARRAGGLRQHRSWQLRGSWTATAVAASSSSSSSSN